MPIRSRCPARVAAALALFAVGFLFLPAVQAQNDNQITAVSTRAVGGVSIDAAGMVKNASSDEAGKLVKILAEALQPIPEGMGETAGLRKVSLRGLDAEIKKCLDEGRPISDAAACLAGLQRIKYVLVYPEQNDIVLVGPAEGWRIDAKGNLVGATNGRPVLMLDDLLVALRAAAAPQKEVMSCSIDATAEGRKRVAAAGRQLRAGPEAVAVFQEQLGPQVVTVTGVPETSHFARVMVAADYRMKRVSMGFEPSPVRELPSFMSMATGAHASRGLQPRFWLQPEYESLLRDPDGLAWELRGGSVRAMAETDFFDANGIKHPTGKADAISQRWADKMTATYEQLAKADPVFAQLRNCMDLAVVAALIVKENLTAKVSNTMPSLLGKDGAPTVKVEAPKQIPSQATLVRLNKGSSVIAAGGVQMNPWSVVQKTPEVNAELKGLHAKSAARDRSTWWWD